MTYEKMTDIKVAVDSEISTKGKVFSVCFANYLMNKEYIKEYSCSCKAKFNLLINMLKLNILTLFFTYWLFKF